MASKKKIPEETTKETLEEILGKKRVERHNEELNAILSEENIGEAYDQVDIPFLNKQHVLGTIPEWIKEYDSSCEAEIESARRKILNEFVIEEAQVLIEEYKSFVNSETDNPSNPQLFRFDSRPIVLGLKDQLTLLSYFQLIIEAGESEGLKKMVGEQAAKQISAGSKVIRGGQNANIKTYGTKADRERQHEAWRKEAVRLHQEHSKWPWYKIAESVGKKFGKSGRTVREHVKNVCK